MDTPQIFADIIGAFGTDYYGLGCQAHSLFLAIWLGMKARVYAALPEGWQTQEVNFFGHSMGGGIGLLAGLEMARQNPACTVLTWTIGAPKVLTAGLNQLPVPLYSYHTDNWLDPIPSLPPNGLISVLRIHPVARWALPVPWTQFGAGFAMDANGVLTPQSSAFWDGNPGPGSIQALANYHPIAVYMQRAEIRYRSRCPAPVSDLITLSASLRNLPLVQNGNYNVDPRDYIDVPYQNANAFVGEPANPINQGNLGLIDTVAGSIVTLERTNALLQPQGSAMPSKITFFYSIGPRQGVSESWFSPATPSTAVTLANIGQFVNARMNISGVNTFFTYCRIATLTPPVTNRRLVSIYYPQDLVGTTRMPINTQGQYFLPGGLDEGSNDPWSSMLVRRWNGAQYSLGYVRGVPDAIDQTGGQVFLPLPPPYVNAFNTYAALVATLGWGWIASAPSANSPCNLTAAAQNANGTAALTFAVNGATGIGLFGATPVVGSRTQLRISQQVLPQGFNGTYTVVITSPTTCNSFRPLNVGTFVSGNGQGTIFTRTLVPVTNMKIEKFVSRKAGLPFGASRGRRRNRING